MVDAAVTRPNLGLIPTDTSERVFRWRYKRLSSPEASWSPQSYNMAGPRPEPGRFWVTRPSILGGDSRKTPPVLCVRLSTPYLGPPPRLRAWLDCRPAPVRDRGLCDRTGDRQEPIRMRFRRRRRAWLHPRSSARKPRSVLPEARLQLWGLSESREAAYHLHCPTLVHCQTNELAGGINPPVTSVPLD